MSRTRIGLDQRRSSFHDNRVLCGTNLQSQVDLRVITDLDFHVALVHTFEAGSF
jgi:hypothetical protein